MKVGSYKNEGRIVIEHGMRRRRGRPQMWGAAWGDERASRWDGSGRDPGGAGDGRRSPPRLLERADHGPERQEAVVAAKRGRVEARDRAVEEERVRGAQAVAEEVGELAEGDGPVRDREHGRLRVAHPDAVADFARDAVIRNFWVDAPVDHEHRPRL